MEKKKISIERKVPFQDAVTCLEDLLSAFKLGSIEIQKGENTLVLFPAAEVTIEIEAKHKRDRESFSLEISWSHFQDCKEEEHPFQIKTFASEPEGDAGPVPAELLSAGPRAAAVVPASIPAGDKKPPEEMKILDNKMKK